MSGLLQTMYDQAWKMRDLHNFHIDEIHDYYEISREVDLYENFNDVTGSLKDIPAEKLKMYVEYIRNCTPYNYNEMIQAGKDFINAATRREQLMEVAGNREPEARTRSAM